MAIYSYFWKIWLRSLDITEDVNDFMAEVSTSKETLRNEDIADRIIKEGSEIKYSTLLNIINDRDRIVREAVANGYSVLTGTCQITPRVSGVWDGETDLFDPQRHKITVDLVPSSPMRDTLAQIGVDILGVKDTGGTIGRVVDTLTGNSDGHITPGEDVEIFANKARIAGDDESNGVYFVDTTSNVRHKVTRRLTRNAPKYLIAKVPADLPEGSYYLEIVTQYSNSSTLTKAPRTIRLKQVLTVGQGSDSGGDDVLE